MKKILIIAGGMLSLTIILSILIAIFMVTFIKEESAAVWENNRERIQTQSMKINNAILSVKEQGRELVSYSRTSENSEYCQQLAVKLSSIETSLANGSLALPRSSIEQIFAIKNRLNGTQTPAKSLACEQANRVIDALSQ